MSRGMHIGVYRTDSKSCHSERSMATPCVVEESVLLLCFRYGSFDFAAQLLTNLLHYAQDDRIGSYFQQSDKLVFMALFDAIRRGGPAWPPEA